MNILTKLANPMNPLTSMAFIGVGHALIASSFLGLILTYPSEIS